jgi:hypothetical protein
MRPYPVAAALFPLFAIAAQGPGWYRATDVWLIALIIACSIALIQLLAYAAVRGALGPENAAERAAFATFVVVVMFYAVGPEPLGADWPWADAHAGTVALLEIAAIAVVCVLLRRAARRGGTRLHVWTRFLTVASLLLGGASVVHFAYLQVSGALAVRRSTYMHELDRPVPVRTLATAQRLPDVYVILLDAYPSADVLRERFGIDNRPFEDSLRALGFRIPRALRSNYANTLMSLNSLLNFEQPVTLRDAAGARSGNYTLGAYGIAHNRAAQFYHAHGGEYVLFPSAWFAPTHSSPVADETFDPHPEFDLGRAIYRSTFATEFLRTTAFSYVLNHLTSWQTVLRDHAVETFDGLASLPPSSRPRFVFAHVLMPHIPYYVDASCNADGSQAGSEPGRVATMRCLDRLVLQAVRGILARSATPPVIILQGDHGSQSLGIFNSLTALPTVAQARERFRPFGAYYLPNGGGGIVPDSTSIVNVLRYVFSQYAGADLPPLPNTMYYSNWERPYDLTRLNDRFEPMSGVRAQARLAGPSQPSVHAPARRHGGPALTGHD